MIYRQWSWIGACSTGSSHISTGTGCQDAAACIELPTIDGSALLAIVSDGAGTAEFGAAGGACVVRSDDTEWQVPSWPAHGEYASSTYFVTDDPQPQLRYVSTVGQYTKVAVFSDGLERLALDFTNTLAVARFFDPMFSPLSDSEPRRDRQLSAQLRKFLDSGRVVERTDDDKSLILARRVAVP